MWGKVKLMMQYIHKNFINDYDWFIKGDDDMFLITENLRYMLSAYSTEDPIYFGYKFNSSLHKTGFFSGGSGYVMSRKTVQTFVEKMLTNKEFFRKSEREPPNDCHIETDNRAEDWDISLCLDHYNVYAGDSRDLLKRDRFFPYKPEAHLFGKPDPNFGYWQVKYYWNDEGLDCCSNYTISFHYIPAKYQYSMYFLTYRLQPFGIKRHFPPPPKKRDFTEVKNILDREGVNATLRGY
ncbi:glycoprotein-N-acetylgalactosamine 3-beta-galactosyltransferase 1-like [Sitodiplosis mosellana]|uniref:glycoprotein-N-acetylgalactosamine 3-beta-galactosyltransferase 1-like n=1 Tax=Sitodiplosis mosellana TaxID=263140 RepID=UPI002444548F|nr:glycoprotein-N-acetylgalactosamine 3-beta-galactosyltransferase 1-like [Sitodiplosis mosellana]